MKHTRLVVALLALLTAGCVSDRHSVHPHGIPPGQAKKLAHAHASGCGHILVDGVWITVSSGHAHGSKKGKRHKN